MTGQRQLTAALAIGVLAVAGIGYVTWRALDPITASPTSNAFWPDRPGTLLFVDESDPRRPIAQVSLSDPAGPATTGDLSCHRVHAAAGTLVCLRTTTMPPGFEAAIIDADLRPRYVKRINGTPSRARVSPSGSLVAWTVFRAGDSYLAPGGFSTTTTVYDLTTGDRTSSLEDLTITIDGVAYRKPDANFWGVTFAADDRTFYATMAADGRTWLVRGDLNTRTVHTVLADIECPSLSPDGTGLAYKRRNGDGWRLHVLNLATGHDTALAETASVDDQAVWLDEHTVGYAKPMPGQDRPGIYAVPADGTGTPRLLRPNASSPAATGRDLGSRPGAS